MLTRQGLRVSTALRGKAKGFRLRTDYGRHNQITQRSEQITDQTRKASVLLYASRSTA